MKRTAIDKLLHWKDNPDRKPLILQGARQVGKTWLMKEFGKKYFKNMVYVNFEDDPHMKELFANSINPKRILTGLSFENDGKAIIPEETLIIFDEVQEVPRALTSLKYFCEDEEHSYYIIAAGSLLGIALHQGTSYPVGKVETLNIYPLSFREFLSGVGNVKLANVLDSKDFDFINTYHHEFIDMLRIYYYVGGMPDAVNTYVKTNGDYNRVREVQKILLAAYQADFSKHAPKEIIARINMVWNGIPAQLAKENKKFIYGLIREGARAREFEVSIQWLVDCGLCHKVERVKKGEIPLPAFKDFNAFKLYCLDVGLLSAMNNLDAKSIIEGNKIFSEYKGALTEQYVCQQLKAELNADVSYWSAENSRGEVDFVLQHNGRIVPIEVKAEENLQAKSLKNFVEKYNVPMGVRTSMSNFRKQEKLVNVPLCAIGMLLDVEELN